MKFLNTKRRKAQEMLIDEESADKMFMDCNEKYFNNELPKIPIVLMDSDKNYGLFNYSLDTDNKKIVCHKIMLNKMQRTQKEYINTMVHEMLHYKVVSSISEISIDKACWCVDEGHLEEYDKLLGCGKYAHGGQFKELAREMNAKYGLDIKMK